jgi:DNA-binding NarL/FixJ family response regulator
MSLTDQPDNKEWPMSMSRSHVLSTQLPAGAPQSKTTELLRILLIGQELRAEALRALLCSQDDMKILSPISDFEQVNDIMWRINGSDQPIDVVTMDWDGSLEANFGLLQALSNEGHRVLVISSLPYPGAMHRIEEAGAQGYCHTSASAIQLANAIRKVAAGKQNFILPEVAMTHLSNPRVKRQAVFCQERLEARAAEIGWVLTTTDINIISHFDSDNTDEIAERVNRRPGTVRTDLSARIFLFLQLLSGRQKIPNKKVGYQVLLEFGIFEYR